jgi:hypothetical protein
VLPDMSDWLPGDIILFAGDGRLSSIIEQVQRRWSAPASRWTHAAMYVGDGRIAEAISAPAWRVVRRGLDRYPPHRTMLRLHDQHLSAPQREALVAAVLSVDTSYDPLRAVQTGIEALLRGPDFSRIEWPSVPSARRQHGTYLNVVRGLICSDLIEAAYGIALRRPAAPRARRFVPPAALFDSSVFVHSYITLCRIPSGALQSAD